MPIPVISEFLPKNGTDFTILDDRFVRGGFHCVSNLSERNAISTDRRKLGMKVYVTSTDIVYELHTDLNTWITDRSLTKTLQDAYNNGHQITIVDGVPFVISNGTSQILTISADNTVEFGQTLRGKDYTSSITSAVSPGNPPNTIIDTTNKTKYRAVQYFYTVTNSDQSGYETGQLYIIHDGVNCSLCAIMGNAVGNPTSASFGVQLSGYDLNLTVTIDDVQPFSRLIHLFKIALT